MSALLLAVRYETKHETTTPWHFSIFIVFEGPLMASVAVLLTIPAPLDIFVSGHWSARPLRLFSVRLLLLTTHNTLRYSSYLIRAIVLIALISTLSFSIPSNPRVRQYSRGLGGSSLCMTLKWLLARFPDTSLIISYTRADFLSDNRIWYTNGFLSIIVFHCLM